MIADTLGQSASILQRIGARELGDNRCSERNLGNTQSCFAWKKKVVWDQNSVESMKIHENPVSLHYRLAVRTTHRTASKHPLSFPRSQINHRLLKSKGKTSKELFSHHHLQKNLQKLNRCQTLKLLTFSKIAKI